MEHLENKRVKLIGTKRVGADTGIAQSTFTVPLDSPNGPCYATVLWDDGFVSSFPIEKLRIIENVKETEKS